MVKLLIEQGSNKHRIQCRTHTWGPEGQGPLEQENISDMAVVFISKAEGQVPGCIFCYLFVSDISWC